LVLLIQIPYWVLIPIAYWAEWVGHHSIKPQLQLGEAAEDFETEETPF
jgi:hypothetical protein